MIRIALRLDDPSATSDHELERELLKVLAALQIPLTAAVIPVGREDVLITPENVPHLLEAYAAGLLEVAQHGLSHDPLSISPSGNPSEFVGLSKEKQQYRIRIGKELLTAVFKLPINGFVPPWNSMDALTAEILAEEGFFYASISSETKLRRTASNLRILPHTCNIKQLEAAYLHAKKRVNPNITIIAILHHYDFQPTFGNEEIKSISMKALSDSLNLLREDPNVEFTTLGHIAEGITIKNSWKAHLRRCFVVRLHWRLRQVFPHYQLLTHPLWYYLIRREGHAEA